MQPIVRIFTLSMLLLTLNSCVGGKRWWDERWDHRCLITLAGRGTPIRDLPVVIRGVQLKTLAGTAGIAAASFRIIGPEGEIASQFDSFSNSGAVAQRTGNNPNDNDELVFQIDLTATGQVAWLYWNSTALPPPQYPTRVRIGDPMEPAAWQHDIQLWNDRCLLGMRAPARGANPGTNQVENWGAGALVLFQIDHELIENIGGAWSSVFPSGAIAGRPCADAGRWALPQPLVRGAVRVAAGCVLTNAAAIAVDKTTNHVDVEHRVWLYARGAYVKFDERINVKEPIGQLSLGYEKGLGFGRLTNDFIWYSEEGQLKTFQPTAEQITDAEKNKVVFQAAGMDSWLAGYSSERQKGYAVVLDAGESRTNEKRSVSCYSRLYTPLRYSRVISGLTPGQTVAQSFWVIGLQGPPNGRTPLAMWPALTAPAITLGPVEKRGER